MVGCIWMIPVLLCIIAIPSIRSQTTKTTSKYELKFYDSTVPNFEAAKTLCAQDAGFVLRTDDKEVRTVVKATIKSIAKVKYFWIGANRSSNSWTWPDGSNVSNDVLDWKSGQPDNAGGDENCLLIYKETSKYGDMKCSNAFAGTICQKYLAGRYPVRTSNLTLTEGSTKQINCAAEGVPVPDDVSWKKGMVTIPTKSTNGIYQLKYPASATLHLENADLSDEGEYICVASKTVDGTEYESTATSHLRIPSKPMILSIEPQFCNSSLIVKWKPHDRAVGVTHRIRIIEANGSRYLQQEEIVTPSRRDQLFISDNLTSSTLYTVEIYTCKLCSTIKYLHSLTNYTGGIPQPVRMATLMERKGSCNVNWNWPANTPSYLITGYKVITKFTTAVVAISTNSSTEEIVQVASSLSFIIPNRPNRNHTVIIKSQTCAGVGKPVVAKGDCVTDIAAPSSVPKPSADKGTNEIFDDGKIRIKVKVPSQTNGPISCLFVIVEIKNSAETTRFDEEAIARANDTENETRHIAMALANSRISGTSELQIVLGDKSTTRCNIYSHQTVRRNRDETGDNYADYVGQNTPLDNASSYNVYLVTSTPSRATIFFQTSDPLVVKTTGKTDGTAPGELVVYIVPAVALFVLVAIVAVAIFFMKRKGQTNTPEHQANFYEYPTIPIAPGYEIAGRGVNAASGQNGPPDGAYESYYDNDSVPKSQAKAEGAYEVPIALYENVK